MQCCTHQLYALWEGAVLPVLLRKPLQNATLTFALRCGQRGSPPALELQRFQVLMWLCTPPGLQPSHYSHGVLRKERTSSWESNQSNRSNRSRPASPQPPGLLPTLLEDNAHSKWNRNVLKGHEPAG
ncbi:hypothetical protein EYF80_057900 [Liparis tanakae]|uniref:Uncharacterized protein n=1 Tax=Liparis tanakae TaxID=230148 RepID=A0A4Z2ETI4_9TELE|nr:hypothetical protein EYF80_057900 [Liparis tanakae]